MHTDLTQALKAWKAWEGARPGLMLYRNKAFWEKESSPREGRASLGLVVLGGGEWGSR